jgi:hypothetical protein
MRLVHDRIFRTQSPAGASSGPHPRIDSGAIQRHSTGRLRRMTTTLEKPKKKPDLSRMDWEALLDLALRSGYDFDQRRRINDEMLRRVAEGFRNERRCPIRMFHH